MDDALSDFSSVFWAAVKSARYSPPAGPYAAASARAAAPRARAASTAAPLSLSRVAKGYRRFDNASANHKPPQYIDAFKKPVLYRTTVRGARKPLPGIYIYPFLTGSGNGRRERRPQNQLGFV